MCTGISTLIQSEANSPLSTAAGAARIWYMNMNPTPSDISGNTATSAPIAITTQNTTAQNAITYVQSTASTNDNSVTTIAQSFASDQGSLNSMDVADMNADGNIDIITGEYRGNLHLSVWQNINNGASFTQHIAGSGQESFLGARVVGLAKNGARDIVSIAQDTYPRLHLWRNEALSVAQPEMMPPRISATSATPGATTSQRLTAVGDAAGNTTAGAVVGATVNKPDTTPPVTSALSATSTPTLVQHVSGSNAQQRITVYNLPLPNKVLSSNCVIVGVRKDSDSATVTVSDDQNNTYTAGPSRSDGVRTVALYYKLNVTNAPKIIRVTFSGSGSDWVSVVASEFYNVATASAADGNSSNTGSGASLTANNIATTVDGDLIYNYAAVSGDDTSTETSSWTPGSGYTFLSADLFDKHAAQYTIQTTHGTINPPMTMNPTGGWISAGMALKAGIAGTAPGAGIHVDKVLHNAIPVGWSSRTAKVQVPSAGNLLVAIFASEPSATITSISDTAGHSWNSTGADVDAGSSISGMKYVANASASNTNVVTYTYAVSVSGGDTCIVFDISGADPNAPFDKRGTASGQQLSGTSYTGASVTPATTNGLVISVNAVESRTVIAVSPETFMASTTIPETSPWPDDENNGYAIQYNADTATITSSWTSDGPVAGWTEVLAAFKSAPDTTPPTVSITAPAAGTTVSGTVSVTATASDNVGVAGVQLKLDGANLGLEVTIAPYSVTWDTTAAATGAHSLTAVARDPAGNTTTSAAVSVTVNNDTIPPSVNITAPASGAMLTGTITVSATASDNMGVVGVQFQLDGANLGAEVMAAPYSVPWNTATATNTSHTLTAIARDAAGNRTTSSAVMVTVDTIAPTVALTSPANGAFLTGTITVSATASDNVGDTGVQFQLDGGNLGAEVTAAPYSVSWDMTTATNGSHTLTGIARDAAGNRTTSSTVTVTVDTIAPTVALISPANGAFVTGTIIALATASDNMGVVGVQFQLDGGNLGAEVTAAPYVVSWNTTTATNGFHTLTVIARDAAGNRTTSSAVTTAVDAIPPTVSVTGPANGAPVSGTIMVSATALDNLAVAGVQFKLDGANLGLEVTSAPYGIPWNTTAARDGTHSLTAVARDAAGNTATSAPITVQIVNTLFFLQAAGISSDSGDTTISQAFSAATNAGSLIVAAVSWSGAGTLSCSDSRGDTFATIPVVYDNINDRSLGICYAANINGGLDTVTAVFSGSLSYRRLLIHEYSGVVAGAAVDVTALNIADGTTDPDNVTTTQGITTSPGDLIFAAVMDESGVNAIQAGTNFTLRSSVNGADLASEDRAQGAAGGVAATWSFTAAHRYLAQMIAFKSLGASIDNTPPAVSITAPAAGMAVSGTITVSATTSDNVAVAGVQFQLDGGNLGAEVTAAPYSVSWNTTSAANGSHSLTAIARDAAGNRTTSSAVTVTVDNIPPTVSVISPANGALVSGMIMVSATASDNLAVVGVQFQLDGGNLGAEVTASPYAVSWNTTSATNGAHTLTAIARDAAGNRTTSSAVTVTVSNSSIVAFVQGSAVTNDTSSKTIARAFAAATAAGDLIVAAISWGSNATVSCSDSQGNTYAVAATQYDSTNKQSLAICYAANIKGGVDTITATLSATAPYRRLLIHEYRGIALSGALDVVAKNLANGSTASNAITSTAATATASGDLVFGAVMDDAGVNNITAGTGFTMRQSVNNKDLASEDLVQASSGSVAATFTFSAAHRYLAQMVTFKHR